MSSLTNNEYLKIFESFLKENFYINIKYDHPNISVYYNTITNDILTVITEINQDITKLDGFSDYISIVVDSNDNRIDIQDQKIGIIYIDQNGKSLKDSIIIAKTPVLQAINPTKRNELKENYPNVNLIKPFWYYVIKGNNSNNNVVKSDRKQLEKGSLLIDSAIENYCSKNGIPRDNITNLESFMDHLLPDIFKYKITVSEEQAMHQEIKNVNIEYPEVFLKSLFKMGYLE